MQLLNRNRLSKLAWTLIWLIAFIVGWQHGAQPEDVSVPHGDEVPPWARTTTAAPLASTKMRFQVDEEPEFNPKEHDSNLLNQAGTVLDPDPWKRPKQGVWKLMILFQHNFPILKQAVQSFERSSNIMVSNMIIVDNSKDQDAVTNDWLKSRVDALIQTPRQLNFPELHNFMATTALQRNLKFYFWAHSDNYVLSMQPHRDMGKDVIDCLREQVARFPNWGMLLFAYDHLAAYRTQTLVQVPWDPHVFQYGSECDAYGRIRDAGYDAKACKVHHSYDMKQVLDISDTDSWQQVKAKLEHDQEDRRGRNQWRETAMSEKEQTWRQSMKQYSRTYLASKWGEVKCKLRGVPCSKPWPWCVKDCPPDLPFCYSKTASGEQLHAIHARVHSAFDSDPDQPPKLES